MIQALDAERALALYRTMARIRAFEDAAEGCLFGGIFEGADARHHAIERERALRVEGLLHAGSLR